LLFGGVTELDQGLALNLAAEHEMSAELTLSCLEQAGLSHSTLTDVYSRR